MIGIQALDEDGVVIEPHINNTVIDTGEPPVLPSEPMPDFTGDFRTPAERRAAEAYERAEAERLADELAIEEQPVEPAEIQQPAISEPVIKEPVSQPQAIPKAITVMIVITLALSSLALIGVLRKQYSTRHPQSDAIRQCEAEAIEPGIKESGQPIEKKNNALLWTVAGMALYFGVTRVVIPSLVITYGVLQADQEEVKNLTAPSN
ncbi:MAG: hypothetical protein WBA76_08970 [Phormidesmis sp.]